MLSAVRGAKDFSNEASENNWVTLANKTRTVKSLNMLETGIKHLFVAQQNSKKCMKFNNTKFITYFSYNFSHSDVSIAVYKSVWLWVCGQTRLAWLLPMRPAGPAFSTTASVRAQI